MGLRCEGGEDLGQAGDLESVGVGAKKGGWLDNETGDREIGGCWWVMGADIRSGVWILLGT